MVGGLSRMLAAVGEVGSAMAMIGDLQARRRGKVGPVSTNMMRWGGLAG